MGTGSAGFSLLPHVEMHLNVFDGYIFQCITALLVDTRGGCFLQHVAAHSVKGREVARLLKLSLGCVLTSDKIRGLTQSSIGTMGNKTYTDLPSVSEISIITGHVNFQGDDSRNCMTQWWTMNLIMLDTWVADYIQQVWSNTLIKSVSWDMTLVVWFRNAKTEYL